MLMSNWAGLLLLTGALALVIFTGCSQTTPLTPEPEIVTLDQEVILGEENNVNTPPPLPDLDTSSPTRDSASNEQSTQEEDSGVEDVFGDDESINPPSIP